MRLCVQYTSPGPFIIFSKYIPADVIVTLLYFKCSELREYKVHRSYLFS